MVRERVAAVATRRSGVFTETQASLRRCGYDRVIHVRPKHLLNGPDVFWVVDLRINEGMDIVRGLLAGGRTRGMVITTGTSIKDVTELVEMGLPSLLILAHVESPGGQETNELLAPLSTREIEVLQWMAEGLSRAEAAERMNVTAATIKSHLHRIARKTGSGDTAHSVLLAMRAGLVK